MSMVGWTVATARTKVYGLRLGESIRPEEAVAVANARVQAGDAIREMQASGESITLTGEDILVSIARIECDGVPGCPCESCKRVRELAGIGA